MASGRSVLVTTFTVMVVVADALLGVDHNNAGGNFNPHGIKPIQAAVQARKARFFGCIGLDLGDINVTCSQEKLETRYGLGIDCAERVPLKTRADFQSCPTGFSLAQQYTTIVCKFPGKWDNDAFTCDEIPTPVPTTTNPTTTTKNSTAASNTTTKPTTKTPVNATIRAANTSTLNTIIATANSATNMTTTTTATTTIVTTTTAAATTLIVGNPTTITGNLTRAIPPEVYETVVGVGLVRKSMKSLSNTEAVADCAKDGAVLMFIDTTPKVNYVTDYMSTSSIFAGAANTYDFWVGVTGDGGVWKTARGIPVSSIPSFKWLPARPVPGNPCAVWVKTFQAHWDYSAMSCNTSRLAYICEKP